MAEGGGRERERAQRDLPTEVGPVITVTRGGAAEAEEDGAVDDELALPWDECRGRRHLNGGKVVVVVVKGVRRGRLFREGRRRRGRRIIGND